MTKTSLKSIFLNLLKEHEVSDKIALELWSELEEHYMQSRRFYHNFSHLVDLHEQLLRVKTKIEDWNTLLFSAFYHDVIYKSTRSDNEERSADLAVKRLSSIGLTVDQVAKCKSQILSTKAHLQSPEMDTNYLIDADLSILGRNWDSYEEYSKQIRKEYSIYPNFLYNRGRKKVVNHFLGMKRIFKTDEFLLMYEESARSNLRKELNRY